MIAKAAAVLTEAGAREVHVFGSAAEGSLREHSDIAMEGKSGSPLSIAMVWGRG